jgi:RNA polymerase sigma-70 factor (ECF subfamily)
MSLNKPDNKTIDLWVRLSQEGDKEMFAQLYDHFFGPIYRYVYFRVNPSQVDDIVETVFIKCWVNLGKYEKRDVSFAAWLFRIAHNAVIDFRRSHRPLAELSPQIKDVSRRSEPQEEANRSLLKVEVREAIDQLKGSYRQVVMLKFLSGLSHREIAETMRQKEGNIRVIQFRALKQLKQILEAKGLKPEFL